MFKLTLPKPVSAHLSTRLFVLLWSMGWFFGQMTLFTSLHWKTSFKLVPHSSGEVTHSSGSLAVPRAVMARNIPSLHSPVPPSTTGIVPLRWEVHGKLKHMCVYICIYMGRKKKENLLPVCLSGELVVWHLSCWGLLEGSGRVTVKAAVVRNMLSAWWSSASDEHEGF